MKSKIQGHRLLTVFLAAALLVSIISVGMSAAADDVYAVRVEEEVQVDPGQTVDVPVSIYGNSGLAGFGITIKYDTSKFVPLEEVYPDRDQQRGFKGVLFTMLTAGGSAGTYTASGISMNNVEEDGILFTFPLIAREDAIPGPAVIEITYDDAATVIKEGQSTYTPVPLNPEPIQVTVTGEVPPDPKDQDITFTVENRAWYDPVTPESDSLDVPVTISEAKYIGSIDVKLTYDTNLFTITAKPGEFLEKFATHDVVVDPVDHPGEIWITAMAGSQDDLSAPVYDVAEGGEAIAYLTVTPKTDLDFGAQSVIGQASDPKAAGIIDGAAVVYANTKLVPGTIAVIKEENTTNSSEEPTGPSGSEPTETTPSDNGTTPSGSDTNPSGTPTGSNAPGGDAPQTGVEDNALLFAIIGLLAAVTVGVTAFAAKKSRR